MKISGKQAPKIKSKKISSPEKSTSTPSFAQTFDAVRNPRSQGVRLAMATGFLALGGFFIKIHPTVGLCALGMALWGLALYQIRYWFPPVPGIPVFSGSPLQVLRGSWQWGARASFLAGAGVWVLVAASNHFLLWNHWISLVLSFLLLGALFSKLEKHSASFRQSDFPSTQARSFPWPALAILLVGAFFLFYGWDIFPIGHDNDAGITLELFNSYILPGGHTTPYVDAFSWGNPGMAYFLVGLFLKVVGASQARALLFLALLNLVGYLFFYGFLRFYLPKAPALGATLLFSTCYWVVYWARETRSLGLLLPLESAALFFFARAIEKGKAGDFAAFGTLFAFLLMVAVHSRALAVVFFLVLLALGLARRGDLARQWKSWLLAGATAFLWCLPMLLYYLHSPHPFLDTEEFARDSAWGGHFFIPWENIVQGLQMFNWRTTDTVSAYLPRLSPWEGLLLLAGFAWCLWRFFNPAFFFILVGFFLGLVPAILSNRPTLASRALTAAPFLYLLVAIGLDRLGRVVAAPLGSRGVTLRNLFMALLLALSIGWHYDVFFHQLPKSVTSYSADGSDNRCEKYLLGRTINKYFAWDTCVEACWWQENAPDTGFSHTLPDVFGTQWKRITFWPAHSPLPLKNVPLNPTGVAFLFSDTGGKAFGDWLHFYYPDAKTQLVLNPFQDVKIRLWEISPDQIQKAAEHKPGPPPGGLLLGWYDSKNHKLGQWLVPSLSWTLLANDYFRNQPGGAEPFPWAKVAYFTAQGNLDNSDGRPLALETNGSVDASFNGQEYHWSAGGTYRRFELSPLPKGWVRFQIRYVAPGAGSFGLGLSRRGPEGWDLIPASGWRPDMRQAKD